MPILLPADPEPCAPYTPPTVVSLRNDVTSLIGGNRQRNSRKGDHYRASFNMPPMAPAEAMVWRSLMTGADTLVMAIPQPDFDTGAPGTQVLVKGAGQLGTVLVVDGVTPQYAFRKGQMITIITSGRRWTYGIDAETVANAAGQATLVLEVMIRTLHADNDLIEVAEPKIEGFAEFDAESFMLDDNGYCRLAFVIEERG